MLGDCLTRSATADIEVPQLSVVLS